MDTTGPEHALDAARTRRAALRFLTELDPELLQFAYQRCFEELSRTEVVCAMAITRRPARTLEQLKSHHPGLERAQNRTSTPACHL